MRISIILKILGLLLMMYSFTMLPPILVSFIYQDGTFFAFLLAFVVILAMGLFFWSPVQKQQHALRTRDGFMIVFLFWVVLGSVGAIPLIIAYHPHLRIVDAVFEAVSGLTTTGATVLTGLDFLPPAILYYRQQLQFLGGMGIIVLAVAILPMLGIGGMQLYRAESTGPVKDNKLTPRLAESAKALWLIYVGLTISCALCFWLGGMTPFDAISYSFGAISTGGYAPHDASLGFYNSTAINIIAIIFMYLGAVSFSLHFMVLRSGSIKAYLRDPEFKFYLLFLAVGTLLIFYELVKFHFFDSNSKAFISSLMHVISFSTTTGFTANNYSSWPAYSPYILLLLATLGGCAGSTSGGIKMIRVQLLFKQSLHQLKKLIHPNGNFILKFGHNEVANEVMESVWAFTALFVGTFIALTMLLLWDGMDLHTAFSTVTSAIANLGPALGKATVNFQELSDFAKWVLSFTMILGRLELFTVLVIFSRTFWRS